MQKSSIPSFSYALLRSFTRHTKQGLTEASGRAVNDLTLIKLPLAAKKSVFGGGFIATCLQRFLYTTTHCCITIFGPHCIFGLVEMCQFQDTVYPKQCHAFRTHIVRAFFCVWHLHIEDDIMRSEG